MHSAEYLRRIFSQREFTFHGKGRTTTVTLDPHIFRNTLPIIGVLALKWSGKIHISYTACVVAWWAFWTIKEDLLCPANSNRTQE